MLATIGPRLDWPHVRSDDRVGLVSLERAGIGGGVLEPVEILGGSVSQAQEVAENADFVSAIYGSFPVMIAVIAVLTFLLPARAFRSLLLPFKAVVLNVISVAADWGVITLIWQEGHGSNLLWGIAATHSITSWIPLMVFAFLFGLSMDYEVFILSRMREEYDATGSTDIAVVRGIGRTGRLVTSGHPARRDAHPGAARPRGRVAVRALELVVAGAAGPAAAGRALASPAGAGARARGELKRRACERLSAHGARARRAGRRTRARRYQGRRAST